MANYYLDLHQKVSEMFLELSDVLVEVKQPLNKYFDLSAEIKEKGRNEIQNNQTIILGNIDQEVAKIFL